jgi:hypothetical protein
MGAVEIASAIGENGQTIGISLQNCGSSSGFPALVSGAQSRET